MTGSLKQFTAIISNKALGFAAVFVLAAGVAGNMIDDIPKLEAGSGVVGVVRLVIYDFIKALKLFSLGLPETGVRENWLLVVARLVGSLLAMAAIFKLIATVFRQDVTSFFASFYKNHTVVLGYGTRNARFLAGADLKASKRPIVIVDNDAGKAKSFSNLANALFFQSDLSISGAMAPANVARAGLILIGAGSDERNLALARSVTKARPASPSEPGRIVLTIDDAALAEHCSRDPEIARPQNGDDLVIFNMATLTARSLLTRTPFSDLALSAGQDRVHLVIAGFSATAQEIIVQFLRISACQGLAAPRIDVIARDRKAALNQLLERCPNLGHAIRDPEHYPAQHEPLSWAADIRIHSGEPAALSYDEGLIASIASSQGPTAFVVATQDAAENVKIGLALKAAMRVDRLLAAPVYVRLMARSSLEGLLVRYDGKGSIPPSSGPLSELRGTQDTSEALEPFGSLEDICNVEALCGQRERLARKLHDAYCTRRKSETAATEDASTRPWRTLEETFRQANRRSADHLPVKLLSAGSDNWRSGDERGFLAEAIREPARLEQLARLEHMSWRIDRELDGWRYGPVRDNRRLIHPDLVEYELLSERSKSYDRDMIAVAAAATS
ncbi:RyR domain-containing protein (plasmid) [Agrobacterium vitis]|uniref:RyR domain-containing protein n=1 Tax=Agrobacterium vitis TaxID=373 RepID=UPI003D273FC6